MSRISEEDVRKVAGLARLGLPDDRIHAYAGQLERILDYVAQLESIDTTGVPCTTRAVEVVNVTRDDDVRTAESLRDDLLGQAPEREGNFFRVPRILN